MAMAMTTFQCLTCIQTIGFRSKELSMVRQGRSSYVRCETEANNCPVSEQDHKEGFGKNSNRKKLKILIAGGGIGGLVLALAAKHTGFDVKVFEKDLSAIRGEGRHRGPIQLMSSALAALKAIDANVCAQVVEAGCVLGNRTNGFVDGISGKWFIKFDLLGPAVKRGLPVSQVICRMKLQEILVNAVGFEILSNKSRVVDFIEEMDKVTVVLGDGSRYVGDILVGADGIWSQVRGKLFGKQDAKSSNYTCYSGVLDLVAPNIGWRKFLGSNKYFVVSDVGNGKMQWFAFTKEPPMKTNPPSSSPGGKKGRVLEVFGNWCSDVVDLITATEEENILQRDIYDRDMMYRWGVGRVTLIGDAAHPMLPNLGQGGCMTLEDCHQLMFELDKVAKGDSDAEMSQQIALALRRYEKKRMFRVSIMHGASRIASELLAYYESHPHLFSLRIANPAFRLVGGMILQFSFSKMVTWIVAGQEQEGG